MSGWVREGDLEDSGLRISLVEVYISSGEGGCGVRAAAAAARTGLHGRLPPGARGGEAWRRRGGQVPSAPAARGPARWAPRVGSRPRHTKSAGDASRLYAHPLRAAIECKPARRLYKRGKSEGDLTGID